MMVSTFILWFFLAWAADYSVWGIIIAVLLDAAGFWLAVVYLVFIRFNVTAWIGLQSSLDAWVVHHLVIPLLTGFLVTRIATALVARFCAFRPPTQD